MSCVAAAVLYVEQNEFWEGNGAEEGTGTKAEDVE